MVLLSQTDWKLVDEPSSNGYLRKIVLNGEEIGRIHYQSLRLLSTAILDDVDDDEAEVMYPLFKDYQMRAGYYIHDITIHPLHRNKGIGSQLIAFLKQKTQAPILLYSLADAQCFWERMGFEQRESYYYTWEPDESL